ncbi:magnesium transporter [Candidatus Curtissbacteria bacterium]|nr:magnesium transporter [Candidatus Curtissbacteria bacterium]
MDQSNRVKLEDDTKESVHLIVIRRIPWLFVGLLGGFLLPIISSRFEELLSQNISLVFFIPVIVYLSGAIATQSETIYVRNIGRERVRFSTYLIKELFLGSILGVIFAVAIGLFALIWLKSAETALTLGLAMLANASIAPVVGITVARILQKEKTDPALGAGPFTTVLQDLISLTIYLVVASSIIFS